MYVVCSRCQKQIEKSNDDSEFTAGYYNTSEGFWARFAEKYEKIVCDSCMWKDERYIKIYGHHS
jgi:hypothetical protein